MVERKGGVKGEGDDGQTSKKSWIRVGGSLIVPLFDHDHQVQHSIWDNTRAS